MPFKSLVHKSSFCFWKPLLLFTACILTTEAMLGLVGNRSTCIFNTMVKLLHRKMLEAFIFMCLYNVLDLKSLTLFSRVSRGKCSPRKLWYHLPSLFFILILFSPKSLLLTVAKLSCSSLLSECFLCDPVSCPEVAALSNRLNKSKNVSLKGCKMFEIQSSLLWQPF